MKQTPIHSRLSAAAFKRLLQV